MNPVELFRINSGYCHVFNDKIILSENDDSEKALRLSKSESIHKYRVAYFILAAVLGVITYFNYVNQKNASAFFLFCLSFFFLFNAIKSIGYSSINILDKKDIKKITYKKPIVGVTRARFEVLFLHPSSEKIKKRLILLPGVLKDGPTVSLKAKEMLTNKGYVIN